MTGLFSSEPTRKSPKRVEAGKKAATTAKVTKPVTATKKTVKKGAKNVIAPVKKSTAGRSK